jgi:hypothetical protein
LEFAPGLCGLPSSTATNPSVWDLTISAPPKLAESKRLNPGPLTVSFRTPLLTVTAPPASATSTLAGPAAGPALTSFTVTLPLAGTLAWNTACTQRSELSSGQRITSRNWQGIGLPAASAMASSETSLAAPLPSGMPIRIGSFSRTAPTCSAMVNSVISPARAPVASAKQDKQTTADTKMEAFTLTSYFTSQVSSAA